MSSTMPRIKDRPPPLTFDVRSSSASYSPFTRQSDHFSYSESKLPTAPKSPTIQVRPNAFQKRLEKKKKQRRVIVLLAVLITIFLAIVVLAVSLHLLTETSYNIQTPPPVLWAACCNFSDIIQLPPIHFPGHYRLFIGIDLDTPANSTQFERQETKHFWGNVTISMETVEPTDFILLHSVERNSEIKSVNVTDGEGHQIKVLSLEYDAERNFLLILLSEVLSASEGNQLSISFESVINRPSRLWGLYSLEQDVDSGISTQLQPGFARLLFPCFDEPIYKASLDITVQHDNQHFVRSNMPAISSRALDGHFNVTTFLPTPRMPIYLAAIYAVPNYYRNSVERFRYHSVLGPEEGSFPVTLFNRDFLSMTNESIEDEVDLVNKTLALCERLFGLPYQLDKLDLAWVNHFANGMENWGLITINDDMWENTNRKTVVHEIIHQWVGNLVTIKWWDDLWITEGLTRYIEFKFYQQLFPDNLDKYEMIWEVHHSRTQDKPLIATITSPDKGFLINDAFYQNLVYFKGGGLFKSIEMLIGEEQLRSCIGKFVQDFAGSAADVEDFLTLLDECTDNFTLFGMSLEEILTPWLRLPGMPVVSVSEVTTSASEPSRYRITQQPYCIFNQSSHCSPASTEATWNIPVLFTTLNGQFVKWHLLKSRQETFTVPSKQYMLVNYDMAWPMAVSYDSQYWNIVLENILDGGISNFETSILLADLAQSLLSGVVNFEVPLKLLSIDTLRAIDLPLQEDTTTVYVYQIFNTLTSYVVPTELKKSLIEFERSFYELMGTMELCKQSLGSSTYAQQVTMCMRFFKMTCEEDADLCTEQLQQFDMLTLDVSRVYYSSILYIYHVTLEMSDQEKLQFVLDNYFRCQVLPVIITPDLFRTATDTFIDRLVQGDRAMNNLVATSIWTDPVLNRIFGQRYSVRLAQAIVEKYDKTPENAPPFDMAIGLLSSVCISSDEIRRNVERATQLLSTDVPANYMKPKTPKLLSFESYTANIPMFRAFLENNFPQ